MFQLDLAPTTAQDLAAIKVGVTGGSWNIVAEDGQWAIGVTTTLHGKLINNADSSISTMDLANGVRIYLHLEGGGTYLYTGAGTVTLSACSDAAATACFYTAGVPL